jgi:hypothetical protein
MKPALTLLPGTILEEASMQRIRNLYFVDLAACAFLLLAAGRCAGQTDSFPPEQIQADSFASAQVLGAEHARTSALVKGDVATLDKLLADDLTYVHATGKVDTKASFLEGIRSGSLHYLAWDPKELHVRLIGDTAVLTGKYAVRAVDKRVQQDPLNVNVIVLSVYAKRDGRWQQVAWQTTKDVGLPSP